MATENEHPVSWKLTPQAEPGEDPFQHLHTYCQWTRGSLARWATGPNWELIDFQFPDLWMVIIESGDWTVGIGRDKVNLSAGMVLLIPPRQKFTASYANHTKPVSDVWSFHLADESRCWRPTTFNTNHIRNYRPLLSFAWRHSEWSLHVARQIVLDAIIAGELVPENNKLSLPDCLFTALEYLSCNLRNPGLSVENIAIHAQCSTVHLRRLFLQHGFHSPRREIVMRRLDAACRLLCQNSGSTVESIALQVGFASPNHFYTVFHRAFGLSPTQWRAQAGGFFQFDAIEGHSALRGNAAPGSGPSYQ